MLCNIGMTTGLQSMGRDARQKSPSEEGLLIAFRQGIIGGESGIRTHGGITTTAVFKTAALNHSAISPLFCVGSFAPGFLPCAPAGPACGRRESFQTIHSRLLP